MVVRNIVDVRNGDSCSSGDGGIVRVVVVVVVAH